MLESHWNWDEIHIAAIDLLKKFYCPTNLAGEKKTNKNGARNSTEWLGRKNNIYYTEIRENSNQPYANRFCEMIEGVMVRALPYMDPTTNTTIPKKFIKQWKQITAKKIEIVKLFYFYPIGVFCCLCFNGLAYIKLECRQSQTHQKKKTEKMLLRIAYRAGCTCLLFLLCSNNLCVCVCVSKMIRAHTRRHMKKDLEINTICLNLW